MNLYAWAAPSTPAVVINGYTSKGCYSDSPTRVLAAYSFIDQTMTIRKCVDTCKARGFSIAGVEA
jgi:hypothetical protein